MNLSDLLVFGLDLNVFVSRLTGSLSPNRAFLMIWLIIAHMGLSVGSAN